MNSRSATDNLMNFSTDLGSTLNQLDTKEPLLSFPFDHLYACTQRGDRRQTLRLREVEITTHRVAPRQEKNVNQRLAVVENQNKKLKNLLIYHLDLIQQQNELMSKKEKAFQALKQENETLKSAVTRSDLERKVALQNAFIPAPLHVPVTATVTSGYKTEPSTMSQRNMFDSFNDLLFDDQNTSSHSYLYNSNLTTPKSLDIFGLDRTSDSADLQSLFASELSVPSILDVTSLANEVTTPTYTMIDNTRSKRGEPKVVEPNNEPKYTVTTNSGNAKISRNRKKSTGIGSLSRMPKTKAKPQKSTIYDNDLFGINSQSQLTYSKSKYGYTALQERLQLIEPTPTGEDPYQIGEAEMREQSPIPKLMLQKTNHGRMRIYSDSPSKVTPSITHTSSSRRIYDTMSTTSTTSKFNRSKLGDDIYSASNMNVQSKRDASLEDDQDVDVEKSDSDIDWSIFTTNKPKERSLCDFSYGESSANLINIPLDITKMEFPDFFEPSPVNADSSSVTEIETTPIEEDTEKNKKRGVRTTSLAGPFENETTAQSKPPSDTKRGRKRAHSTAASIKRGDISQQKTPAKRVRRAVRAKKTPVAGMMTKKIYHTNMGDPDLSWYLGLDPDIKKEDCDPTDNTSSNVEVPRWREKVYAGLYSLEGIENLDDKVFEKRHQKLEAEERRQLRWHMRRIREQRHVERLRQRQRDPWGPNSTRRYSRGEYTVWPQPIRDLQYIEITDTLPVTAFGEDLPELPEKHFLPPWVRFSKALKRSKRSKTLH